MVNNRVASRMVIPLASLEKIKSDMDSYKKIPSGRSWQKNVISCVLLSLSGCEGIYFMIINRMISTYEL